VVGGYWLLPRRLRLWWLFGASILFYATWNLGYVPGFLLLIGANYLLGLAAARRYAKAATVAAIVLDLAVLILFKYLDAVLGSSASLVTRITGEPIDWGGVGIVLPLAISFVTFTLIAYVVDVYRGAEPERDPLRFAVFIAFFPRVLSGPIMRGSEFLPQLRFDRRFSLTLVHMAVPLLVSGLFKKALADELGPVVRDGLDNVGNLSSLALMAIAVAWSFQLYLDFAGYTDMARGSSRLLGIGLPRNFDWPYRSLSMAEFWRRWHITLGAWLRDYLYFPLGGSRGGDARTYLNLMITMTLAGAWHGAGPGYALWGFLQGVGLSVDRWWRRWPKHPVLPVVVSWAVTFTFVVFARVPFVSPTLSSAAEFYGRMLIPHGGELPSLVLVVTLAVFIAAQWTGWEPIATRLAPKRSARRWLAYGVAVAIAIGLLPAGVSEFIYQQF
jgi:D-alanyl-lipoteichoic acid acyltransferase DltB (MBOAT superfamily)